MKGRNFLLPPLKFVLVLWGGWLYCNTVAKEGLCRHLKFTAPIDGYALQGHVIKNISLNIYLVENIQSRCNNRCTMESSCVSFNIGPPIKDMVLCQLSDSDHIQHPKDLQALEGFMYRGTENPCSSNPCLHNENCLNGFTDKKYLCRCQAGYTSEQCETAENCAVLYKRGERNSGVYTINPDGSGAFDVLCDQTTADGGWTVFQRRIDGSVDFYRDWAYYKRGFGNLTGEFWLGLDKIHNLSNSGNYTLRVDLVVDNKTVYAAYDMFTVGSEGTKYQLGVGNYSGTAGDSLAYHNGHPFTTLDQDNDSRSYNNCAVQYKGAWWYNSCFHSNLNSIYRHGQHSDLDSILWAKYSSHVPERTEMKIRPVDF